MDREVEMTSVANQLVAPRTHFIAAPTRHSIVVNRQRFVWNDQVGIDADNIAEAFASRTSTVRIVEREKMCCRRLKSYSVCFKT